MRTSRAFLAWSPILPLPPRASAPARNAAAAGPRAFSFFSAAARRPESFGAADWEASPPPLARPRRRAHRTTPLWAAGFRTSARHPEAQLPPSSPGRDDDEPDEMFAKKFSIGDIPVGALLYHFVEKAVKGKKKKKKKKKKALFFFFFFRSRTRTVVRQVGMRRQGIHSHAVAAKAAGAHWSVARGCVPACLPASLKSASQTTAR
ncbi:MAG: hypothetical protein BJ554DRAFT_4551 [Olpidium bornovanus]|uniref:Uncharacterized protein n=1 Tax=Olpidium bornovanus TaxID=278681 RepID=A0A8H7ZM10_9FUNG|nr:MAG: hypothetical protein BJ554DRAFT_4551 [Olpidium bornovanus]